MSTVLHQLVLVGSPPESTPFHQSLVCQVQPPPPPAVAQESRQQRERAGGGEGEGLKGVLFEGKGRSQSPVHRLSGLGAGLWGCLLELKVL